MKIQEIARLAGVSTATVSRVFSHHPSIRPEVREHVFAVARHPCRGSGHVVQRRNLAAIHAVLGQIAPDYAHRENPEGQTTQSGRHGQ